MSRPLRVCIDARVADGPYQGAGAVVRCLVRALSQLDDGAEEYCFLAYRDSNEWLRPYVKRPEQLLLGPASPRLSLWRSLGRQVPGLWPALGYVPPRKRVPASDGTIEAAGVDLIHFTMPTAFLTSIPSIYEPHDLQHLHLPQLFSRRTYARRELEYRAFCHQAACVAVMSVPGKVDLLEQYSLPEEKVVVVPWAPAVSAWNDSASDEITSDYILSDYILKVRGKFSLPASFIFYPAHTWPHKNHVGLLDALAIIKNRHGLQVPLVCTGHRDEFFSQIKRRVATLGLEAQVRFLGFVTPQELRCLYVASRFLIFPSKFEGWGLPLTEAFALGAPAACSDISPLREQAQGAALLFNPTDPEEIAAAICRLWTDAQLRQCLADRGKTRASLFTWDRTARAFRALYRKLGRRPLSNEDCNLLSATPIV